MEKMTSVSFCCNNYSKGDEELHRTIIYVYGVKLTMFMSVIHYTEQDRAYSSWCTIKCKCGKALFWLQYTMTSSNGDIFRVPGLLCGEFTCPRWIPLTKTIDYRRCGVHIITLFHHILKLIVPMAYSRRHVKRYSWIRRGTFQSEFRISMDISHVNVLGCIFYCHHVIKWY